MSRSATPTLVIHRAGHSDRRRVSLPARRQATPTSEPDRVSDRFQAHVITAMYSSTDVRTAAGQVVTMMAIASSSMAFGCAAKHPCG